MIKATGLTDFAINNFSLITVLGGGNTIVRVAGEASVLPGAQVQIIAGKQAGGQFGGMIALAIRGDAFTMLLEKMIPGFKLPGLNLVASASTVRNSCFLLRSTCS